MFQVTLRAYGRLNDFLPPRRRQHAFELVAASHQTVKDLVESTGIPHPEIALILLNSHPASLDAHVRPGDRISVFPPFRSIDPSGLPTLVERPGGPPRFVLDTHLGRLAGYLRMLGFDTLYHNDYDDPTLERIAVTDDRILLTRDVGLLKRGSIARGYFVREADPRRQLTEVVAEFDLLARATPFTRCLRCNGLLRPVAKSEVEDRLPPRTRALFEEFWRCESCGTVYWNGSHHERMRRIIAKLDVELGEP